jgi:hypothetical protein
MYLGSIFETVSDKELGVLQIMGPLLVEHSENKRTEFFYMVSVLYSIAVGPDLKLVDMLINCSLKFPLSKTDGEHSQFLGAARAKLIRIDHVFKNNAGYISKWETWVKARRSA